MISGERAGEERESLVRILSSQIKSNQINQRIRSHCTCHVQIKKYSLRRAKNNNNNNNKK